MVLFINQNVIHSLCELQADLISLHLFFYLNPIIQLINRHITHNISNYNTIKYKQCLFCIFINNLIMRTRNTATIRYLLFAILLLSDYNNKWICCPKLHATQLSVNHDKPNKLLYHSFCHCRGRFNVPELFFDSSVCNGIQADFTY